MSDNDTNCLAKALALREALVRDVGELTYDQAREEVEASGQDVKEVAMVTRAMAMGVLSQARKDRLTQAQVQLGHTSLERGITERSIEGIRRALARLAAQPESIAGNRIAMAYRNGKVQSDSDVQSLWQDLVELGAVRDDDASD